MKKIKSGFWSRAPKLFSSAIKLSQLRDIDKVVENLSELKGVPQKIGQLISMDISEYLPVEMREKFSKLQGTSAAIEGEKILEILKDSLGETKFSHIRHFNQIPLGAGSIGQVHQAVLLDQRVVFKVKYPKIELTLKNDLALMIPVVKAYELFRPESQELSILLKEARTMLLQEMDYEQEVKFLLIFKKALKEDNRFSVPIVIEEYSSKNIICMEYLDGMTLKEYIGSESSHDNKSLIATNLLELFIFEFFSLGLVQTDSNFANYLILSNKQIILLDFGATKEFKKDFRDLYFSMLKASYDKNIPDILHYGELLGLVDRKDNSEAVKIFIDFMMDVMSFFRPENNPIDFTNETITKRLLDNGWALFKKQRISAPHSNLVFLHRKLGGLFSLLKESKISIDLYPMWQKILELNK